MRILVASLNNIGDLVFASALVPPLRRAFPDAHITVWCKAYASAVAPLVPGITDWEASDPFWDRAPGMRKGGILPFARSVWRLRRRDYDVAVLASPQWRVAAATAMAGIPRRIGMERNRNRRWLTDVLPPMEPDRPVVAQLLHLLEPLGVRSAEPQYRLDPGPLGPRITAIRRATSAMRLVTLHPFAGGVERRVPLREWEGVALDLERRGLTPLWLGTHAELEALRAGHPRLAGHGWSDLLGDRSLSDSLAIIAASMAFIGHDSGPLHVAAAFGIPCVGVFAPGEPRRTFPQGPGLRQMVTGASRDEVRAAAIIEAADALGVLPR